MIQFDNKMDFYSVKYCTTSMLVNGKYQTSLYAVPLRNKPDGRLMYHKAGIYDCPRKFKSPQNFGEIDDNIKTTSWREAINWKSNSLSTNSVSSSECNLSSFKSGTNSELDFTDVISVPSLPSPSLSDRSSIVTSGRERSLIGWSLYKEINPIQKKISDPIQKKIESLKRSQNNNLKRTGSWRNLTGRNLNETIQNLNMKQVNFTVKEKDSSYVDDLENHKHFVNETRSLFESKVENSNKISKQSIDCTSTVGEITTVKCQYSQLPGRSYPLIKPTNDVPKILSPKDSKTKPVQPLMGTNALLSPNKLNHKMDQQNTNSDGEIVKNILLNTFKQSTIRRNWQKTIGNKSGFTNTENKTCENSNGFLKAENYLQRISEKSALKDRENAEGIYAKINHETKRSENKQTTQINVENDGKNTFQLDEKLKKSEKSIANENQTSEDDENNNGIYAQIKSKAQTTADNKQSTQINLDDVAENPIQVGEHLDKEKNSTPNKNDIKIISNLKKDNENEQIYSTIPDTYEHHIYEVIPNNLKNNGPSQTICASEQSTEIKNLPKIKTDDTEIVSILKRQSLVNKNSGVKLISKKDEVSDSQINSSADHSIIKSESISTLFSSTSNLSFNSQLFFKEAGILDIDASDAELNAETHNINETYSVSESIKTMDASNLMDSKIFHCTFDKKKKRSNNNIVTSTPNDESKGFYSMLSSKIIQSMIKRKKDTLSLRMKPIKPIKTSFTLCDNLNYLWNEYIVEKERLLQVSKGLTLCYSSKQFSISDAQIELEKRLLTTNLRLQSIENEFRKIDYQMRRTIKKLNYTGTLELSNITVPLKPERAEKLQEDNSMIQWYTCVVSSGIQLYSSQAVRADFDGIIRFQNDKSDFIVTVNKLNPNFVVTVEIYSCKQRNPQDVHNESSQKMECLSPLTFKKFKKNKNLKRVPSNDIDYYSTAELIFKTTGKVEIRLNNLTKKNSRMLLPVPLSSSIDGTINFDLKSSVEFDSTTSQEGFVNFGIVNKTRVSWDKQWCRLDGHILKFWNYPSLQHEEPKKMIDLSFCTSPAQPADRKFCSKLRTILIETRITSNSSNNQEDLQTYLISTDTLTEFMEWIKQLNDVITTLMKWKVC